jgi:dynein heavy chain
MTYTNTPVWPTIVQTILGLLESWLAPLTPEQLTKPIIEHYFVFACIWAFGGSLGTDKQNDWRREFDSFWQGAFREIKFPKESSVYDFYFKLEEVRVASA